MCTRHEGLPSGQAGALSTGWANVARVARGEDLQMNDREKHPSRGHESKILHLPFSKPFPLLLPLLGAQQRP